METTHSAENYELPEQFFLLIKPYVVGDNRQVIEDNAELLHLWKSALKARTEHPEMSETIAEWTMSAAASSSLVDDNNIREAIHFYFGSADAPPKNQEDEIWRTIASEVAELEKTIGSDTP